MKATLFLSAILPAFALADYGYGASAMGATTITSTSTSTGTITQTKTAFMTKAASSSVLPMYSPISSKAVPTVKPSATTSKAVSPVQVTANAAPKAMEMGFAGVVGVAAYALL